MDIMVFIVFFLLVLFFLWLGKKNFDGLNLGYFISCILLIVFGFLLLDSGIQIQNGVLINRNVGGEIVSVDANFTNYTSINNGFVSVLAYLLPFFGFIGIVLMLGSFALKAAGR